MLHEIAHTRNRIGGGIEAHGAEWRSSQDQINLMFDDRGSREFYLSVILEAINRFGLDNIKSLEEKFNELKTVNVGESLDKHENSRLLSRRAKDAGDLDSQRVYQSVVDALKPIKDLNSLRKLVEKTQQQKQKDV